MWFPWGFPSACRAIDKTFGSKIEVRGPDLGIPAVIKRRNRTFLDIKHERNFRCTVYLIVLDPHI